LKQQSASYLQANYLLYQVGLKSITTVWDPQIKRDLEAGHLDSFLAEVDAEYESGLSRPL